MRNDVSFCAVFSCLGLSVWGGRVLWEDEGGEGGMRHGHACCCCFSVSLRICVTSPHGPTLCGPVVLWGRQVLWSFQYSAREGGRVVATWGFGVKHVAVVHHRCGDTSFESATVLRLPGEKTAFDTRRETPLPTPPPKIGKVSEMYCEEFILELLSTDIAFLTWNRKLRSFDRKDRYIYCMQIKIST